MKSRFGIFAIWSFLFSFLTLKVVDDDGAGGGDDTSSDTDGDDTSSDADDTSSDTDGDDTSSDADDTSSDTDGDDLKQTVAELKEYIAAQEQDKLIASAVETIQSRYDDFDIGKIEEHLKEMAKDNPQEAEQYNNPVGWELLWSREFATKDVVNDEFNFGRGDGAENRDKEFEDKLAKGELLSVDEQSHFLN